MNKVKTEDTDGARSCGVDVALRWLHLGWPPPDRYTGDAAINEAINFVDTLQEAMRLASGRCEDCGEECDRSWYSCGNCRGGM